MHRRGFAIAFAAASLLTAMSVGSASAAVVLTTLSAKAGAPGAEVTLGIEMTGRQAGTEAGVLFLVPVDTFSEPTPCEQIDGATALGDMTWHAAQLTFEGGSYPGMASETRFTVPQTPDGAYYLAESWPDPYTRCFSYASFTVDSALPNTATVPSGLAASPRARRRVALRRTCHGASAPAFPPSPLKRSGSERGPFSAPAVPILTIIRK